MSREKIDAKDVRFAIYGMIGEGMTRESANELLTRLGLPTVETTVNELREQVAKFDRLQRETEQPYLDDEMIGAEELYSMKEI